LIFLAQARAKHTAKHSMSCFHCFQGVNFLPAPSGNQSCRQMLLYLTASIWTRFFPRTSGGNSLELRATFQKVVSPAHSGSTSLVAFYSGSNFLFPARLAGVIPWWRSTLETIFFLASARV
jgi:hypothetical protein